MPSNPERPSRGRPWRTPVSTYRLQLQAAFTFNDARALVAYLADLGITDCYSSPHLKAHPGSTHGYDICDHRQLNPELGTPEEFAAWCATLREHGLGHIVDIVPNHMACDPTANPWWRDVLENGPGSPYADYFDIDWSPVKPELEDRVLLPVLGDQYGCVLERGELQLAFRDGTLHLTYHALDLPISPREAPRVLGLDLERLEEALGASGAALREYLSILTAYKNLPSYTERDPARVAERQREKEVARERLLRLVTDSPDVGAHIEACVRTVNGTPGVPRSFDVLHDLLEHQAYRLAYWRTAVDEINYRRFFDVNELAGLRTERPAVFEDTHRLLAQAIAAGQVTGVRVDHPDGLFDPGEYFGRLQELSRAARSSADHNDDGAPLYVVAEKILSRGETLRPDWEVMGTTGYGFLNLVAGLFVDGRNAGRLRRIYGQVTGGQKPFEEVAYASKITIMQTAMASELNVLAHALNRISERDRRLRDFTLNNCRRLLREVVACFQVYRTYVGPRGASAFDRAAVDAAIGEARRRNPLMEVSIFEFLRDTLLPPVPTSASGSEEMALAPAPARAEFSAGLTSAREGTPVADTTAATDEAIRAVDDAEDAGQARLRFAMRFQQVTGPVQAKGVEDTAFYRYNVLVSANDVGGHPGRLDVPAAEFHEANAKRHECWPLEMVTTATHDTKRGEDARLRIAAISEVPGEWRTAVSEWMRLNGRHRASNATGAWAPDRNDEYLFYQTLVGVWPAERLDAPLPARADDDLVERVTRYMQKAVREAKVHTSWIDQNEAYGQAVARFIGHVLTGKTAARFLRSFVPFQRRLGRIAMYHTLSQVALKIASPGVPDFYQGSELWDFNLVDPDNRRPVDFERRRQLLAELRPLIESVESGRPAVEQLRDLLRGFEDARPKLYVTAAGLRARRARPEVYLDGAYWQVAATGPAADHLVAFARVHASGVAVAVVPRLVGGLMGAGSAVLDASVWQGTRLVLPDAVEPVRFRNVFTGETVDVRLHEEQRTFEAHHLLQTWPVALLSSET